MDRIGGVVAGPGFHTTGHTVPYHGGSRSKLKLSPLIPQRYQPQIIKEAFGVGFIHVRCAAIPPWATPIGG